VCASESFAFLTRWVPAPEAATPKATTTPPEAAVYRRLIVGDSTGSKATRLLKRGAIGLAVFSLARWAWSRHRRQTPEPS